MIAPIGAMPPYRAETRPLQDYLLLLSWRAPGQTPRQALETMRGIYRAVAPRHGWQAAHDTYLFLQCGLARGRFPGRYADRALADFLAALALGDDPLRARQRLLQPPDAGGTVRIEDGAVDLGGVRVPVRLLAA